MEPGTITAFLAIGSVILIGFFGNAIFNRYRIPDVLILVLLGMVLGPDVLGDRFHIVTSAALNDIERYRDLFLSAALVIILFDGGLTLDIRSVLESMRLSAFMSIITFALSALVVAVALHFIMDIDFLLSLTLGTIVGGTSGAIVIPIASKLRIRPKTKAVMIMESTITDVLVVVVALTLLSLIRIGSVDLVLVVENLASKFLFGGLIGFLAGIAWLFVLQRLQNQPLSYMLTIGVLFLVAGAIESTGSSGAVAALAFGLSIGNRRFLRRKLNSISMKLDSDSNIQRFHSEISFFVRTFFFVYIGLMFRFDTFTEIQLTAGLLIISMVVLVRWLMVNIVWKLGDLQEEDAIALFGLMPRGLAAAVLANLPAAVLVDVAVWTSHPELFPLFLNATLIVILGTTIISTGMSFVAEAAVDAKARNQIRDRLMNGDE
jgi:cell volume regulation protein A